MQELNEALEEFDDEEFGNIITDIESMSESDYSQEFFEICSNKGLRDRIIRFLQSQDKHDLVGLMEENEGFAKLRNRIKYVAPKSYKEELFNVEEAHHINLTAKLYQLKEKNKDVSSLIKGKTIPILLSIVAPKGGAGKTTIATNIAYILAELGYRVVVVDADHQCNASAEFMMRMYHVFGSIDGSTDDSYFNFDSFKDLQQLYS